MMRSLKPCAPFKALLLPSYLLATFMPVLAALRPSQARGGLCLIVLFTRPRNMSFRFRFIGYRFIGYRFNCASTPIGGDVLLVTYSW